MLTSASAAPAAATLPLFPAPAPSDKVSGLLHAATLLAQLLGQGRALDSRALRSAMEAAFGGSDAEGAWVWKDAYEALEAAQGPVSAQIRWCHARPRGLCRCDARHAHAAGRAAAVADAPVRGIAAATAVLDPDHARLRHRLGGCPDTCRPRAGTLRRNGRPGDLRRARQGAACLERDRRDARRAARPPLSRRRGQPAQRRADPRPFRSGDPPERGADEPALLGLA